MNIHITKTVAKKMARTLHAFVSETPKTKFRLTHAYEATARMLGFANHNTMMAALPGEDSDGDARKVLNDVAALPLGTSVSASQLKPIILSARALTAESGHDDSHPAGAPDAPCHTQDASATEQESLHCQPHEAEAGANGSRGTAALQWICCGFLFVFFLAWIPFNKAFRFLHLIMISELLTEFPLLTNRTKTRLQAATLAALIPAGVLGAVWFNDKIIGSTAARAQAAGLDWTPETWLHVFTYASGYILAVLGLNLVVGLTIMAWIVGTRLAQTARNAAQKHCSMTTH